MFCRNLYTSTFKFKTVSTYVFDKAGGRRLLLCVLFLCWYLKRRTSSSKTLLRVLRACERFQVFDMLQFLFEEPIKTPFRTAYCLYCTSFCMHIGCSHSWAHALGTLLFLFTQAQAHELQVKWIVHLYIHNKSYKLRALFLPTGFFPLDKSGVSTTFFFSTWTLVNHHYKSFIISKSTQDNQKEHHSLHFD